MGLRRGLFDSRLISSAISLCLVAGVVWSQEAPSSLEITIQGGADRVNSDVSTWEIAVQVQDNNGRRVKGAAVIFQLPPGAGTFLNGSTMLAMVTDDDGRAVAHGFRRGKLAGAFVIHISASLGGLRAATTITQTNPPIHTALLHSTSAKVAFFSSIAAAAGVSIYFGVRNNGETQRTAITLGPGTVSPSSQGSRR